MDAPISQINRFAGVHNTGGSTWAGNQFNSDGAPISIGRLGERCIYDSLPNDCFTDIIRDDQAEQEANNQCKGAWRQTDPRDDRQRILNAKDDLLNELCTWILDDPAFRRWWNDDECRILWIHGNPGKGKTMMMMALIEEISHKIEGLPSETMAYFFCQNTIQELNNGAAIIRGLTYFLADEKPQLVAHLRRHYDQRGSGLFEGLNATYEMWRTLMEMLQDVALSKVYLLVDAVDECHVQSAEDFLKLLLQATLKPSSKVKWIISSRNEQYIREYLERPSAAYDTSLELNSTHVTKAVQSFIASKINNLADRKGYTEEIANLIKDHLIKKADGTFLWAALVCKELEKLPKRRALEAVELFPKGLQPLYARMMGLIQQDDDEEVELRLRLLRTVTLTCRPLDLDEIGMIGGFEGDLCDSRDMEDLVQSCGSFLVITKDTVSFVHQSAKDYFSVGAGSAIFPSGPSKTQKELAHQSLSLMNNGLKRDGCRLKLPDATLQDVDRDALQLYLPSYVRYACCYWAQHAICCSDMMCDGGPVHVFLKEHLLHWLEALSLIERLVEAGNTFAALQIVAKDHGAEMQALVYDAKRFILHNRMSIEQNPLQTYYSALVFAPTRSIIRQTFCKELPSWICGLPQVMGEWSACIQILEGHSGSVISVAFSSDGKQIASASEDNTIKVWDVERGGAAYTLEGHSHFVLFVAFSPNNNQIVSASKDKTIKIWDTKKGDILCTLRGHSDDVLAAVFSPDSEQIASISRDTTIRIWDAKRQGFLYEFKDHSGSVLAIAFSSDSKRIVSASADRTIRLWDAKRGEILHIFEGHLLEVKAVAFSPNDEQIVSASEDTTIRTWDTKKGAVLSVFEGHSKAVDAVVFSIDGKQIASASLDQTVRVWDVERGRLLHTLKNNSDEVGVVAYNPNGKQIAFASWDTVQMWNTEGRELCLFKGHSDPIGAIVFSPNGKQIASASEDRTVRVWDTERGERVSDPLEIHSTPIGAIGFSPSGKQVASKSLNGRIKVWNTTKKRVLHELAANAGSHVFFSLDGKQIAASSFRDTIKVWDTENGKVLRTFKDCSTRTIAFSSDFRRVAFVFRDQIIKIWDVEKEKILHTLKGHSEQVHAITFSFDRKQLISASYDKTIKIWDTEDGELLRTFESNSRRVRVVVFSPDGKQIAASFDDTSIKMWDTENGELSRTFEGGSISVTAVAFSPDGKQIAAATHPDGVKLWDKETGSLICTLGRIVERMGFSSDGSRLYTDKGTLNNPSFASRNNQQSSNLPLEPSILGRWITVQGLKVLWLPYEYISTCFAVQTSTLVMGHQAGRVTFMEFGTRPRESDNWLQGVQKSFNPTRIGLGLAINPTEIFTGWVNNPPRNSPPTPSSATESSELLKKTEYLRLWTELSTC
ncbi:MAG: hypothetical protein M1821_002525 [Bathelium mastoideum]|nr:MAG: hypothetical protein M1821_002525 [Bathelium mastoideum]